MLFSAVVLLIVGAAIGAVERCEGAATTLCVGRFLGGPPGLLRPAMDPQ
jgi:hypothetical protein